MRGKFQSGVLTIAIEISFVKPLNKVEYTQKGHPYVPLYELLNEI